MSTGETVDVNNATEANTNAAVKTILEQQLQEQANLDAQFRADMEANNARIAASMEDIRAKDKAHPLLGREDIQELLTVLHANPAIIPAVVKYTNKLVEKIIKTVEEILLDEATNEN